MMSKLKMIGGVLIVSGTAIGAGILALPIIAVSAGLIPIVSLLLLTCLMMYIAAILILEINLKVKPGASFLMMTKTLLGPIGHMVASLSYLFLFYSLLAAYISGAATFLEDIQQYFNLIHFSNAQLAMIAVLAMGVLLLSGIKMVDQINKFIFVVMISCFIFIVMTLQQTANNSHLVAQLYTSASPMLWLAVLPILFTSFGYHGCTTPLIGYVGEANRKKLRSVFLVGGFLPFFCYIVWIITALATLTEEHRALLLSGKQLSVLIRLLSETSDSNIFMFMLRIFSGFAILTSFLGVSLGLFDSVHTVFKFKKTPLIYVISTVITFLPPLLLCLRFPYLFIAALGYAAIPLALIATILPLMMMSVLKKQGSVFKGEYLYWLVGLFGLLVIGVQLAITSGYLSLTE